MEKQKDGQQPRFCPTYTEGQFCSIYLSISYIFLNCNNFGYYTPAKTICDYSTMYRTLFYNEWQEMKNLKLFSMAIKNHLFSNKATGGFWLPYWLFSTISTFISKHAWYDNFSNTDLWIKRLTDWCRKDYFKCTN